MKLKKLLSVLTIFMLLGNSSSHLLAQSAAWPDGLEVDFGSFDERGVERLDSVALFNNGSEPFVIENIRPSCGCTAVDWSRAAIAPGDTTYIPIAFRCTKGGSVERHLDVYLSHLRGKVRIWVYADCPLR